ncbi:carbohydrate kinase family protein [Shuttleworthella satelles]|uniref:Kinase, PfkB family n=1 Tax=Shuttleworthella satelles DSM 14600 TaxID=626523 RepID=C4GDE1_9FIRM|nr:carbohydrate kinase [Shuttleworthia satelles]EEP27420.1 kinase, PfkB family [Shuttleworthia satelles DSM 14600]
MKQYDVTALGELLIDFTENGLSEQGNPLLEANPGGAPCNVLAMLAKYGRRTAFIGKVGEDAFGRKLAGILAECGIDTEGLCFDPQVHTTLAFVHKLADGDRDFSFYRNPGADMMLSVADVRKDLIRQSRIFHFGTLSMTDPGCRQATEAAIGLAKESEALISFDPNLRPPLWRDLAEAKEAILYGISQCHVLKISDNEIEFITGMQDYDRAARSLQDQFYTKLICVTLGEEGSRAYYGDQVVCADPYPADQVVDTTGAGDTFTGSMLNFLLERADQKNTGADGLQEEGTGVLLEDLEADELERMLKRANAGASLIVRRRGALRMMPEPEEITALCGEK